jgi:hypothetical protein
MQNSNVKWQRLPKSLTILCNLKSNCKVKLQACGLEILLEACHHYVQQSAQTKGLIQCIVPFVKSFMVAFGNQDSVLALPYLNRLLASVYKSTSFTQKRKRFCCKFICKLILCFVVLHLLLTKFSDQSWERKRKGKSSWTIDLDI